MQTDTFIDDLYRDSVEVVGWIARQRCSRYEGFQSELRRLCEHVVLANETDPTTLWRGDRPMVNMRKGLGRSRVRDEAHLEC